MYYVTTIQAGPETRVNSNAAGEQVDARVAGLAGGGWVVVWNGRPDNLVDEVFQRRFDAFGNPIGVETIVNPTEKDSQIYPDVAAFGDGRWVVGWTSNENVDFDILNRRYLPGGDPQPFPDGSASQTVNVDPDDITADLGVALAVLPDGGWVAAWGWVDKDDNRGISFRRYTADGQATAVKDVVTSPGDTPLGAPVVAARHDDPGDPTDGGFIIAWTASYSDGTSDIFMRTFGADGTFGPPPPQ